MITPGVPVTKKATTAARTNTTQQVDYPSVGGYDTLVGKPVSGGTGYIDSTAGPVVNPDGLVAKYKFNPPLISDASGAQLPDGLFPGPGRMDKGFLFQDPNIELSDELEITTDGSSEARSPLKFKQSSKKYGFRFLYNPPEVSMSVGYAPGVDVKVVMNNLSSVGNPITPQTGSNIQFELWLNRIEDLSYGRHLAKKHYPNGSITAAQIERIKSLGTMADYEYLLLCLNSGKKLPTKYRGLTADIGWLLGGAVVVKLGKSLVYQGLIENVSINHVRFTPKMVPALSSVQISMSRFVDLVPASGGGSTGATDRRSNGRGD